MDDLIVKSKFSKEETIRKLKEIFSQGNEYAVELKTKNGEYYLTSVPVPSYPNLGTEDSFFIQFKIKENNESRLGKTTLIFTPQSKALSAALGSMFLMMLWILIFSVSVGERRWLGIEVYALGLIVTLVMVYFFKMSNKKENIVLQRIMKEFE